MASLTAVADTDPSVMVFGTLRFHDTEKWPAFSMIQHFPNDAHVTYAPAYTPFGADGMAGTLEGTHVHFCDLDNGYIKEMQRLGLERVTGLLVQGYGATFATSTRDVDTCVRNAMAGKIDSTKAYEADLSNPNYVIYDVTQTGQTPVTTLAEQLALLEEMGLTTQQEAELITMIQNSELQLAEAFLYDTASTDGDIVALISGSMRFEVELFKTHQRVIVPITGGSLKMEGVRDGAEGSLLGSAPRTATS